MITKVIIKRLLPGLILLFTLVLHGQEKTGDTTAIKTVDTTAVKKADTLAVKKIDTTAVKEADTTALKDVPKRPWTTDGTFALLFNQTAFSNWLAGGQNSIGGNIKVDYSFNYAKGSWSLQNKINASYGMTKIADTEFRKTDDQFNFNSLAGLKTSSYWSYSFFFDIRTQLTPGFNYVHDPDQNFANSGFLRPGYISFGLGMLWEKTSKLKFNLSPLSSKITLLAKPVSRYDSETDSFVSSDDRLTFGVEPGRRIRLELGFYASGYFKFDLMKNVTAENIISLYTNYLEDPENVDINYQLNINMKINEYLAANIAFQIVYDDNAFAGFQVRQLFGAGFNYSF